MSQTKVAITIEEEVLARVDALVRQRVFANRSRAIQEAVQEKLERMDRSRLAEECAKLDPAFERQWQTKVCLRSWLRGQNIEGRDPVG